MVAATSRPAALAESIFFTIPAAFDEVDARGLEALVSLLSPLRALPIVAD
jgi:hypothetical protein